MIPGFNMALRALTKPGDEVVVQVPAYPPILNAHEHHGIVRSDAHFWRDGEGRYEIGWDSFDAALARGATVFVLCNPHNPIGRVFTPEELRRMADICLAHDAWIVSDEIHWTW